MTDQPAPARRKKKRLIWIIPMVVALIIAGVFIGSRIYADTVSAQAEDVPKLTATPTAARRAMRDPRFGVNSGGLRRNLDHWHWLLRRLPP